MSDPIDFTRRRKERDDELLSGRLPLETYFGRTIADVEDLVGVVCSPPRPRWRCEEVTDTRVIEPPQPGVTGQAAREIGEDDFRSPLRVLIHRIDMQDVELIALNHSIEMIESLRALAIPFTPEHDSTLSGDRVAICCDLQWIHGSQRRRAEGRFPPQIALSELVRSNCVLPVAACPGQVPICAVPCVWRCDS